MDERDGATSLAGAGASEPPPGEARDAAVPPFAVPPPTFAAAVALHRQGRLDEARPLYRAVLGDGPAPARRAAASNLGRIEAGAGRFAEAVACFRASLAVEPAQPDVLRGLGEALLRAGDPAGAAAALRDALALRPDDAAALHLFGRTALDAGDPLAALERFDAALARDPASVDALFARGLAMRALGRHAAAADAFACVVALRPGFVEAYNNHGRALHDAGRPDEAATAYGRALALAPGLAPARLNASALALERGRLGEAKVGFAAVLAAAPGDAGALAGLVHARQHACDWDGLAPQRDALLARIEAGAAVPPFIALASGAPDALQTLCAASWAAAAAPRRRPRPEPRAIGSGPVRIGYLSGDFHDHATTHLVTELIERHDRARFAVHGYSYGPHDGSPARARLARAFDRFVDLADLSDEAAADCIRADGVDLLIDLKGYTAHARPQIVALRPAAVQVNWLGFPGSMGVDFIDAVLADATTAPLSLQPMCAERIVHLPDGFQPTDTTRRIGEALPRAAYGLPERGFVFCCFNNGYKFAPEMFALWMRLLRAVEGSVLWLLAGNAEARANLRREAGAAGVDPDRLVLAPRLPMAEHLARHQAADLFLDTQPVNAMTTASDALWAGLPVLTCLGATVAGRSGASLVRAAGLPELVARDIAGYEALALHLARAPERLAAVRERLALLRATAPLFDTPRFVRDLEAAFLGLVAAPAGAAAESEPGPPGRDDFDHMGDAWTDDAPAVWADLRRRCPVARTERHGGLTLLTRYDDVRAVAYDLDRFSSARIIPRVEADGVTPRFHQAIPPLNSDPPEHREHRAILVPAFSRRAVERLEPDVAAAARRLIAALPERGEIDAARDFARPLARSAMSRMLGVRDADMPRVAGWAEAAFSTAPDAQAEFDAALDALLEFLAGEVRHRVDNPGDDVTSHLLSLRQDGRPLPTALVKATLRTLALAGSETIAGAVGSALDHLACRPALARRLAERPDLLPAAVEEMLRLGGSAVLGRQARAATEVRGCPLAAGDVVLLAFGAANRDPDAFPDPDEVVLDRPGNPPHLAFGAGIHRCIGQHLARSVLGIAMREWLAAVSEARPGAGPTVWQRGLLRGPARLPLAIERAASSLAASPPPAEEAPRRDSGALHGELRLDLGGHRASAFVRIFNPREARRTLLCLHGFPDNGSDFLRLGAAAGEAAGAAGFRVICPDWPGRGRSERLPPHFYTMETYFAVVRACLAHASGPVSVVANSFGNLVAILFLAGTGMWFERTVLVDPVLRGGPAYDRVNGDLIGAADRAFDDMGEVRAFLRDAWPSAALLTEAELSDYALARVVRVGGRLQIACDPALGRDLGGEVGRAFSLVEALPRLNGRLAVAYGEHSTFKDPQVLAAVAACRPDAAFLPDLPGGHAPLLRSAGEVAIILDALTGGT